LDVWRLAFNRSWMPEKPNNGFMLLVNNTIVGVLCALYAQRQTQEASEMCVIQPHGLFWMHIDLIA
jgi:hypothetical protein